MSTKNSLGPDAFDAHEVLHAAHIVADLFERRIEQHHYTRATPEIRAAAQQLSAGLHDFYQLVGSHAAA